MNADARWQWLIPTAVLVAGSVLSAYLFADDAIANGFAWLVFIFTLLSSVGLFIFVLIGNRRS